MPTAVAPVEKAAAHVKTSEAVPVAAPQGQPVAAPQAAPEVGGPPLEEEKSSYDLILNAFKAASPSGAQQYLVGKKVVDMTVEEAAARTLVKNLTIRFAQHGLEKAGSDVMAAKGVYDPVISMNLGLTYSHSYIRKHFIFRNRFDGDLLSSEFQIFQKAFEDGTSTGVIQPQIIIDGVNVSGLLGPPPIHPLGGFDFASFRSISVVQSSVLTLSQQIPWGASYNISLDSIHVNDRNPVSDANSRPWTSNLNVNLSVPVPMCKDWGRYGFPDASIKLAKIARERAFWDLNSAINANLSAVGQTYWELVRTVRRLEMVSKTRANLEEILGNTEKMIQAGRATAYEKNQVQTEIAKIKGIEEGAWADYLVASNSMRNLLDYEKEVVLLPSHYTPRLGANLPYKPAEAYDTAMGNNPDIKVTQNDLEFSKINLKFAENQSRPNVKLVAGMSYQENNAVYGFGNQKQAIGRLVHPDSKNNFIGLNFSMPWGNRPAEERLNEASALYMQSEKNAGKVVNLVDKRLNDALAALDTGKKRVAIALKNKETAERVYQTVVDLWNNGRVPALEQGKSYPAFELLQKNTDRLNAQFGYIDAVADYKKAEIALLFAEGTLNAHYSSGMDVKVKPADNAPPAPVPAPAPKKEGGAK
ncbi:MAG: TolC family protein [Planctomycetes bacterium]|nr:TolC family protein [Planctomycetota bacterium]